MQNKPGKNLILRDTFALPKPGGRMGREVTVDKIVIYLSKFIS
jgi:hypothetical protein